MLVFVVLGCFLALTAGQIIIDGECDPEQPVQPDFDVNRYSGVWYEIYRYEQTPQRGGECVTAKYTPKGDGSVGVLNRMVLNGRPLTIEGTAELNPEANGCGKLIVKFPSVNTTGSYWVLNTDYSDYSLVYSCTNTNNKQKRLFSWILSRTPSLSPQALTAINPDIKATDGLDWSTYRKTSHTKDSCRIKTMKKRNI